MEKHLNVLRMLFLSTAILLATALTAAPSARIGTTEYTTLPAAVASARSGDVIRVTHDLDWGKCFLPTGVVATVDLDGHRVNHYFWLSSGGTLRNGEIVPHAGWAVASFYGDGVLENLAVTNAPADSALIGFGRAGVTVDIRSGDYTTGAIVSTTADTTAHYRLNISGGRFSARLWYDARKACDANIRISGGKWAYDPTTWLAPGFQTVTNATADAADFPFHVLPR